MKTYQDEPQAEIDTHAQAHRAEWEQMADEVGNISDEPFGRLFLLPWVPGGLRTLVERRSRLAPILTLVVGLYCVTTLMSGCVAPRSTNQGTNTEALGAANSRPTVETPFTPEAEESGVNLGSNSDGTAGTTNDLEVIVEPSPVPTATPIKNPTPEPTNTPTPQPTETVIATPTETEAPLAQAKVVSPSLNVRSGNGTNFEVIGGLKQGAVVTIIGKADNGWWNVILENGTEGWVSGGEQYIVATSAEEVPAVKTPRPPLTATPAPAIPETSVSQPGTSESRVFSKNIINNSPTAVKVPVYGTKALNKDNEPIGSVVQWLNPEESIPAADQEEWWFPVQLLDGSTGYIHLSSFKGGMSYLDRTPAPPPIESPAEDSNLAYVRFLSSPDLSNANGGMIGGKSSISRKPIRYITSTDPIKVQFGWPYEVTVYKILDPAVDQGTYYSVNVQTQDGNQQTIQIPKVVSRIVLMPGYGPIEGSVTYETNLKTVLPAYLDEGFFGYSADDGDLLFSS